MESDNEPRIRYSESSDATKRYCDLKDLGREIFDSYYIEDRKEWVARNYLGKEWEFLRKAAHLVNPPVWSSFWEHIFITRELADITAEALVKNGLKINQKAIGFISPNHDDGRLVNPSTYLRNDRIADRLFVELGIPQEVIKILPSQYDLMERGHELGLELVHLKGEQILSEDQIRGIDDYFESLSHETRIMDLADNLGKRDEVGLFNLERFFKYLMTEGDRYTSLPYPSTRWAFSKEGQEGVTRQEAGDASQGFLILKEIEWLKDNGVDFEEILSQLKDFGPKFIILARHGDLKNEGNMAYGRDAYVADKKDVIRLSMMGRKQMRGLAKLIKERKFRVARIFSSPQQRAIDSEYELRRVLGIQKEDCEVDMDLDENDARGIVGMSLKDLNDIKFHEYDPDIFAGYGHETPEQIAQKE